MARHNENVCPYDFWAPNRNKIENVAFSLYATHYEELDNIIYEIVDRFENGESDITIEGLEYLSDKDLDYIHTRIEELISR